MVNEIATSSADLLHPVKHNITSISQLRKHKDSLLNSVQQKGLKYYEDIIERIPRSEIVDYQSIIHANFQEIGNSKGDSDMDHKPFFKYQKVWSNYNLSFGEEMRR